MSEINILDSSIFNRISAGEVVESPYSVVKELVENSVDAGASAIQVEINGGGIDYIKVTDNGKGMEKGDIEKAFLPHATSKIKCLDDLDAIGTLGFRGEALPSIASVSEITFTSKRHCDELGYFVTYENGKIIAKSEIGSASGSAVIVKNLFQNVPARRKFLKRASSEASKIKELVKNLILANPKVKMKLISDGKTIYSSDGADIKSAIFSVYGEIVDHLTPIFSSMSGITLSGYVSNAGFSKHNKSFQTIIVNNRVVESDDLSYSIYLSYRDFLMTRQYPIYVLYISIPNDLVDVNVHPNKLQVKFVDTNTVKKMVHNTISKAIRSDAMTTDLFNGIDANNMDAINSVLASSVFTSADDNSLNVISDDILSQVTAGLDKFVQETNSDSGISFENSYRNIVNENMSNNYVCESGSRSQEINTSYGNFGSEQNFAFMGDGTDETIDKIQCIAQKFENISSDIIIIGKLFNTYIVVQNGDNIFLIDQHAAHERILYDKIIQATNNLNATQQLLIPYEFEVSSEEADFLDTSINKLKTIGFFIEYVEDKKYKIISVPTSCININLNTFISTLLNNTNIDITQADFLENKIAQSACKAAVKGKDDLSNFEIECLLVQMKQSNGVLLCPHGRPTVIKISKTEIEKMFKRVV